MNKRHVALGVAVAVLLALPFVALGPSTAQPKLGTVNFVTSCSPAAHAQFTRGVAMLHSFWFNAALTAFNEAAKTDPSCGIAHWGTAMTWLGNPLAGPPSANALKEGGAAVERGKTAGSKTPRERDFVAAIETFYKDSDKVEHRPRAVAYERAMEQLAAKYPDDREASIFYALALNVTLNPNDKTYVNQLKAAGILEKVFAVEPNHPGVAHY